MLTKTKIALGATLFGATSSVAMAQGFDPNMANRYPAFAGAVQTFQSAPVRLRENRNAPNWEHSNRRVPANQGDATFGGDWAQAYGGGW